MTPNLGNCILEPMVRTWRFGFLQRLVKACKPTISVDYVAHALGFMSTEEGVAFIKKANAVLVPSSTVTVSDIDGDQESSGLDIDTKASSNLDPTLGSNQKGLLL